MEIIENEKNFKSNYKKIIWILIVFNIIFLLAIFGLNYACYSALETKCEDNIQLSTNISKQDKKEAFNTNAFINSLESLGYPYYVYNSNVDSDIQDFMDNEFSIIDIFALNGYYNWFISVSIDFDYNNYSSSNYEPYFQIEGYNYDTYLDNGRNDYYSVDFFKPYSYDTGEFWNSEGSYRMNSNCSLSSLTNQRSLTNFYNTNNSENSYYCEFEISNNILNLNFNITRYNELNFLMYFVPVGDSSELGNYQAGYDKGYQDGLNNADVYEYAQEYYNNGFNAGFQEGIQQGIEESGNNILGNMLLSIFDVPLMYLSSLLNFNLLGINLLGLLGAILCIGLIAFLIKKLL